MRFVLFTFGLGVGLILISCARAPEHTSPGGCGAGQESCGSACVPVGTCQPTPTAGTGGTPASTGGSTGGSAGGTTATVPETTAPTPPPSPNCTDVSSSSNYLNTSGGTTYIPVDGLDKQYVAMANWWHVSNQQTVTVKGLSFTVGNPAGASSPDNDPTGFPSMFIGSYAGKTTKGSNLPKQVSALTNIYTVVSTNASSKGYTNYNVAYDVWFTAAGTPLPATQYNPGTGGAFLMVWLFKPTNRQPRGSNQHPGQSVSGLPGTWDVWIDPTNPPCISYVSTTPLEKLDYDLNNFIRDAVNKSYGITNSMYLSIIFAGFEIWGGGDGLQEKAFCANVL
jgi:hypothetical protein